MSSEKEQQQLNWLASVDALDHSKVVNRYVREALTELSSENANVHQVGILLSKEPALTAKLLMIANSPFYGFHREVKDIEEAIVVLGGLRLKALINSSLVLVDTVDENHLHYIQHSLVTAFYAQKICKQLGLHSETLFTSGLFHILPIILNYQVGIGHLLSMPVLSQSSTTLLNKLQLPLEIIQSVNELFKVNSKNHNAAILRMAFDLSVFRLGQDSSPFKNLLSIENDFGILNLKPLKLSEIYWDNQKETKDLIDMVKI